MAAWVFNVFGTIDLLVAITLTTIYNAPVAMGASVLDSRFLGAVAIGDSLRDVCSSSPRWNDLKTPDKDMTVTFIDPNRLDTKEPREGWKGRFFHSRNMTFAYYAIEAGAWIHEHSHPNDEVWNIIDGQLEITIAGEARVVGPGCAAVIPPDTPHSVKAITNSRVIVVDHPPRHLIAGIGL